MDTCPDFHAFVKDIEGKLHKKDAIQILKHVWGLLDKEEQKMLYDLLNLHKLTEKDDPETRKEIELIKHFLATHPEAFAIFNKFYTRVITPVTSKDHFKNDRIKAAAGLEKVIRELQSKSLVKHFDIKRVA
jgi:hypothetical protein